MLEDEFDGLTAGQKLKAKLKVGMMGAFGGKKKKGAGAFGAMLAKPVPTPEPGPEPIPKKKLRRKLRALVKGQPPPMLHLPSMMGIGVAIDTTGDGKVDAVGYDTTGDGKIDAIDTNADGKINVNVGHSAAVTGTVIADKTSATAQVKQVRDRA